MGEGGASDDVPHRAAQSLRRGASISEKGWKAVDGFKPRLPPLRVWRPVCYISQKPPQKSALRCALILRTLFFFFLGIALAVPSGCPDPRRKQRGLPFFLVLR